jgi:hypothetical protein
MKKKRRRPNTKCFSRIFLTRSLSRVMHKRHRKTWPISFVLALILSVVLTAVNFGAAWAAVLVYVVSEGSSSGASRLHWESSSASLASTPEASKASLTASVGVVFARMMVRRRSLGVGGEAERETSEPDQPLQLGRCLRSASACSWSQGDGPGPVSWVPWR